MSGPRFSINGPQVRSAGYGPCAKCESFNIRMYHHPGIARDPRDMHSPGCHAFDIVQTAEEHLHLYCQRCRYQWTEPTKDAS